MADGIGAVLVRIVVIERVDRDAVHQSRERRRSREAAPDDRHTLAHALIAETAHGGFVQGRRDTAERTAGGIEDGPPNRVGNRTGQVIGSDAGNERRQGQGVRVAGIHGWG